MDLTRIILGAVVTEKAERLKSHRSYTLRVAPAATKVEIKNALTKHFDVEIEAVRISRLPRKFRIVGKGTAMEKRHAAKKAIVTLTAKSKTLDLAAFKTAS